MNTPTEQATLYRKAADTIEMCAPHDLDPMVKYMGVTRRLASFSLNDEFCKFEFPVAILEGQLVWADTVVYSSDGYKMKAKDMTASYCPYTLPPPKPNTVMVEFPREYVKYYAREKGTVVHPEHIVYAFRKALDNLKDS